MNLVNFIFTPYKVKGDILYQSYSFLNEFLAYDHQNQRKTWNTGVPLTKLLLPYC